MTVYNPYDGITGACYHEKDQKYRQKSENKYLYRKSHSSCFLFVLYSSTTPYAVDELVMMSKSQKVEMSKGRAPSNS